MEYGCIGEHLPHSVSKPIHDKIGLYNYEIKEISKLELEEFLQERKFFGINVTIPYKQSVIPFLDGISDIAKKIGAVNTVVNRNGKLYGYNTDYVGLMASVKRSDADFHGKKVLILGTGGTSKTAFAVAADLGAENIIKVSRSVGTTYSDAYKHHTDADIIINTTPVGMFPDVNNKPIELEKFGNLSAVFDVIYNPLNTELVFDAKKLGITYSNGLYMLVSQAVAAAEIFKNVTLPDCTTDKIYEYALSYMQNYVLTGMPSSGKTTVGKELAVRLGFKFFDTDNLIEEKYGKKVSQIIADNGTEYFRYLECEVIKEVSVLHGAVIATGGGAVLNEENIHNLKRNGRIFFLDKSPDLLLPTPSRPLSDTKEKIKKMYDERYNIYTKTADVKICADKNYEYIADDILKR